MERRERILIRGVNWLGDAIMTTPALFRLREAWPNAHISLLTHAKLTDLWRLHPAIDEVIPFQAGQGAFSVGRILRERDFSTALILPNSPRSALEVFLARIPIRVGFAGNWRGLFLTQRIAPRRNIVRMQKRSDAEIRTLVSSRSEPSRERPPIPAASHQIYHYLHLTAAMGAKDAPVAPQINVSDAEVTSVRQRFKLPNQSDSPLFGLNPGAEYGPAKRWHKERFIAAAVELQRRTRCHWWIFGGPADEPLASEITAAIKEASGPNSLVESLAGKTSLRELGAALKACSVVLTNDTGPMHLAAAVGTRVVVPFGSTSPELTAPGLPGTGPHFFLKSEVPCSPCFRRECPIDFRCMDRITVENVVSAAMRAAKEKAGAFSSE